jgi:hypothetical protein
VERRISLLGALTASLAPANVDVEVWTPAPVDATRLRMPRPPTTRTGTPPHADLRWADPDARAANDRRLALAVAQQLGIALRGARTISSVDAIDIPDAWVCKLPWTAAGRDRCRGHGPPTPEQRTRLTRLLAITGELVLEPWCERIVDVGVCARITDGHIAREPPHGLLVDARGNFLGIDVAAPALSAEEQTQLERAVDACGMALVERGYTGPFAIDAFVYRDRDDTRRLHPICEINARYSFGWVARALGVRQLGFGPAPANATILIAPADDGITAWCS